MQEDHALSFALWKYVDAGVLNPSLLLYALALIISAF